jgi:ionotropic glutamate receptor
LILIETNQVWIALILFLIILPAILWKHLKLFQIPSQQTSTSILANQYLFVLGVFFGQCKLNNIHYRKTSLIARFINCLVGQKLVSNGFSHRFLAAVWCLTAVVLASAYVGV